MQDATRQGKILSFFLMKRKESCARKRGGGRGEVFDLFQRYYKLSECSWFFFFKSLPLNLFFYISMYQISKESVQFNFCKHKDI